MTTIFEIPRRAEEKRRDARLVVVAPDAGPVRLVQSEWYLDGLLVGSHEPEDVVGTAAPALRDHVARAHGVQLDVVPAPAPSQ